MVLTGTAYAGNAYQGDDISYGVESNHRVRVCDRETDDRGVHTDTNSWAGTYYRADDSGNDSVCYDTLYMSSGVKRHRTVEEIDNWPDAEGPYSNH